MLNDFYATTGFESSPGSLQAQLTFNPDHDIFKGHFPGQPVVPGVCMIQIAKELLEHELGQQLLLRKGHQVKFLQLLVPDREQATDAALSWQKDEDGYTVQATFKRGSDTVFKLSGLFVSA